MNRRISLPNHRPSIARALVWVLVATFVALATPATASAKSFSMPSVRIDARIQPDGSLVVKENRSFDFSGDFTRVFWDLEPPQGGAITSIVVTGPRGALPRTTADGRPAGFCRVTREGTLTRVEVYGQWSNETVAYSLSYTVSNAAARWSDTSELYWQAIAANWGANTGQADITIHPPSVLATEQVKAWAHGPLTGNVTIQAGGSVFLTVSDLPANTFVEARILFPAEALSRARPRSEAKLAEILAYEAEQANAANQAREDAKREVAGSELSPLEVAILTGVCLGGPFLLALITTLLFFRYGREHKPSFQGQYFREPPADLHPALVGYLWKMGDIDNAAISASLMNLADRGIIRMEPTIFEKPGFFGAKIENTFLLTLDTSKWNSLDPLDQNLLSFLFTTIAGDNTLTIAEMQEQAKERAKEFQDGVNAFKAAVAEEADRQGFVEKRSRTYRALAWTMTLLVIVSVFVAVVMTEQFLICPVGLLLVVPMMVMSTHMIRRSPAAAEMYAKYEALRNFLRDFSRLQEAPPASVILWNQFLVLAVVFGIAEQVIEQMRVVVPQVMSDQAFATSYWWVAAGPGYASPVSALSSGFTSAASIATSTLSSSSGGGGGFSGGGGGGFGGGGGGGAD